ncbi:N-alpha-acetyltransferase MAK3 isoform X2 [Ziziphus jujuba]|uniref:N-alpha-acetyltransferase MAK3 isoform X2 n=1 Tax=Ziziphus jujuba TaxID=326968 RepID=A0ABM3HZV9_ZIZJJ|nr:N-alpha-acetyltransferase MAK3 isoform X2 [Ziziphus jujuba]XP_048317701.1 N-alpha-acetyltransferase MAK3 isoform X2 [Ziziphus jujuba]XP_048317702.1 N-alpha-acetyltransferase MAK3 isoform X2 [Ziziphus jujuba]
MGEHRNTFRGYIAMLVVIKPCRGRGIAAELVARSIKVMMESGCEGVYKQNLDIFPLLSSDHCVRKLKMELVTSCLFGFPHMKVTLEAEVTNKGALALYGRLGFIRAKWLFRYYLSGVDAFRLKLLLPLPDLHPFIHKD